MANLANDAEKAQDLILQIELAEYETDQIDEAQDFARGTKIYWDDSAKKLTETPTPVPAGVVTVAKDANNVIWFRLVPGIINVAANVACAEAATAEEVRTALRALLAALQAAGLMAAADGGE